MFVSDTLTKSNDRYLFLFVFLEGFLFVCFLWGGGVVGFFFEVCRGGGGEGRACAHSFEQK